MNRMVLFMLGSFLLHTANLHAAYIRRESLGPLLISLLFALSNLGLACLFWKD